MNKVFFIKITITNIWILFKWHLKNQLVLQFSSVLIVKVTMEILVAVLMASLFLPKYKCCMNERFLSKVSIKNSGNVTCITGLLLLLLILNKLLKTNKFNFIFLIHYIFLLWFHLYPLFQVTTSLTWSMTSGIAKLPLMLSLSMFLVTYIAFNIFFYISCFIHISVLINFFMASTREAFT